MSTGRLLAHSQRMLRRYPVRGLLTASGSLIGVAALTVVLSLGGIANQRVIDTVHQLFGGASIGIVAGGAQFLGGPHGDTARLTIDDIDAVAHEVPRIVQWDPQLAMRAAVKRDDVVRTARVLGQSERSREVWNRDVVEGRYFDAQAVSSAARVALIGRTLSRRLFGDDDPIGADILVESVPFEVIGVLEPFGTDIHGMDRDNELVVPISTLQRRVLNVDTIVQAKLLVDDPAAVSAVAKQVEQALRARHGLPDGRPDDFTMMTADDVQQIAGLVQRVLTLYLPLIAVACIVAAGISGAVLMLASIAERTPEIGVRRAVGARPGHIALQFVVETATTIAIGGAGGVLLGSLTAMGVGAHMRLGDGRLSWPAALAGIGLSIAIGVAAGLVPARRAARLHPVDALR
jgi:putative ABC transport system permease protein